MKSNYHKHGSLESEVDPFANAFDDFSKSGLVEGRLLGLGDYEFHNFFCKC